MRILHHGPEHCFPYLLLRPYTWLTFLTPSVAGVVQNVNNTNHWINHYPVDSVVCFVDTYPLDSDLSGG